MRDSILREQKDKYMLPVAEQLFSAIHPNVVSFVALGVGLLCAAATINGAFGLGLLLWLLNRVLDGLDGLVARVHHKQSDFGGYLDLLLDFIVYLAVPIALIYALPTSENLWGGTGSSFVVYTQSTFMVDSLRTNRKTANSDICSSNQYGDANRFNRRSRDHSVLRLILLISQLLGSAAMAHGSVGSRNSESTSLVGLLQSLGSSSINAN